MLNKKWYALTIRGAQVVRRRKKVENLWFTFCLKIEVKIKFYCVLMYFNYAPVTCTSIILPDDTFDFDQKCKKLYKK